MQRMLIFGVLFGMISLVGVTTNLAYSQEISYATFRESAQVIIDKSLSKNITASVILQSTSIQEIRIPSELEHKIREDERIRAVTLTNEDQCVLGVVDQSCIVISVSRNPDDKGINAIQDSTKMIASKYIDEINDTFDTDAKFHSVFIHADDSLNRALNTSGTITGKGVISAVYTLPMENTDSMYEKISGILIPKVIRDSGGFYDVAKSLSYEERSKMTFSWIPLDSKSLLQLKVLISYPNEAEAISNVSPLEFFKVDELERSEYFAAGFYPLNSIIQVVVLSPQSTNISDVQGNILPTQTTDGEKIPTDITKAGWVFDPKEGQRVQGKYIFGDTTTVSADTLKFSLGGDNIIPDREFDESIIILVLIALVSIAAAAFYLKGYKK